jgi:hypothetical protein
MVEDEFVSGELATARRLVDLLEQDGYGIDAAVWVVDDEGNGRLYIVPRRKGRSNLQDTILVARTISDHKDELPARHDLRYSIVESKDPIIQAVRSAAVTRGRVRGIFKDGTYIDSAYVLRPAA